MSLESPDPRRVAADLRELPMPSDEALVHSDQLTQLIRTAVDQAGGVISFEQFMQLALYAPGLGYYSAGARKFGAEGDFVTAPELSPLFSRCLARQCMEVLAQLEDGALLEFGAGSGAMAADILLELERLGALPGRYLILEVSADLRQRQQHALQQRVPHLVGRVQWLDALPQGFVGVVLANEVLDAMPVQRLRLAGASVQALGVAWHEGAFVWRPLPHCPEAPARRMSELRDSYGLAEGYETEIGLAAEEWTRQLGEWLQQGLVLLIDYGFPRSEFYHPQRSGGTLMCHYRHRAHGDPLILPGLQDITAHVDFTAIAEAALAGGLEVVGYANQANFLLGNGLLELAQEAGDTRQQLATAAQLKRLMMPGEMGELFKVLALGRGVTGPWRGFALRDDRFRL